MLVDKLLNGGRWRPRILALGFALTLTAPLVLCGQNPTVTGAAARSVAATNGGPRIEFNTEAAEADTVFAGEIAHYTFLVTNTGDATLVISQVVPSCGCTTVGSMTPGAPASFTKEIAPRTTGIIPLQVQTSNLGTMDKTVDVLSNDPTRPKVTLHVRVVVWTPIELNPPGVFFQLNSDSSNATVVVHITNHTAEPLTLSAPQSSTNQFSATLTAKTPGREYELAVTAAPLADSPSPPLNNMIRGAITMKTSVSNMAELSVPVVAQIQPEVMVTPTKITLPAQPLRRTMTNWVTIVGNTRAGLNLSNAAVNIPGATLKEWVLLPGRQYRLEVVFPKGFQPGTNGGEISVQTDNPRYAILRVPVVRIPAAQPPMTLPVGGASPNPGQR